jgi:cardiolipin synthase A/B
MFRNASWRDLFNGPGIRSAIRGTQRYFLGKRGHRLVYWMRMYYRMRLMFMLQTGEPIGKLARRRDVRLWVDGKESFRRLEYLIRQAQEQIIVQTFIWKDDATGRWMARLLLEAADRGVTVDITKEAVGDFFEFHGDFLSTKDNPSSPWPAFWSHPRIRIHHSANNDHAKVFIIDDHTLLLTGMNIADEYRVKWHDYLVELRGGRFVEAFLQRTSMGPDAGSVRLVMNTEENKEIRPVLAELLDSARDHIVIEHCYISDPEVVDMLIAKSRAGVRVTVLLPDWVEFHHHANMVAIGRLITYGKTANVSVHLYPGKFHAKVIVVDYASVFIGSMNLFKNSIDDMGEVNVLIRKNNRVFWKLREALRQTVFVSRPLNSPPPFLWVSKWLAWLGL